MNTATVRVGLKRLPHGEGLPLPAYQTREPRNRSSRRPAARHENRARTGWQVSGSDRHGARYPARLRGPGAAQIRACRDHGVTVLNAPGTIDSDYRGEVRVLLINLGDEPFEIVR